MIPRADGPQRPLPREQAEAGDSRLLRFLRTVFDPIYELDFQADAFRCLSRRNPLSYAFPEAQGLSAMLSLARERIRPEDTAAFCRVFHRENLRRAAAKQESAVAEILTAGADGICRRVRITVLPFDAPAPEHYLACLQDLGAQARAAPGSSSPNIALPGPSREHLRYKAIVEHTHSLVFEWQGPLLTHLDPRIPLLLAGNYNGRHIFDIWREDGVVFREDRETYTAFLRELADRPTAAATMRLRRRAGSFGWYVISCTRLEDATATPMGVGSIRDVDRAIRIAKALRLMTEYDELTGAYTMRAFLGKAQCLIRAAEPQTRYIVRFDVAGFRGIDEIFGQEEGERLLRAIAFLVRENLRGDREIFARLSGDIFLACLEGDRRRVRDFMEWLRVETVEYTSAYRADLVFGVCLAESRETPVQELCDRAYMALKAVKAGGFADYAFYDGELRSRLLEEQFIREQMHSALAEGQFVVYLQPKVEMFSGRIVGAEALARWRHPERGLITPDRFVPLFERNGFIVRLDEFIWEETCKLLRAWLDRGYSPTPVSVNVSRLHFNEDDFCAKLLDLTRKYRLPRHLLELELTESAFFENERVLRRAMRTLQEAGFLFSMDDFGTGYSSLNTLRALPFNIVKLDRAFVSDGTDNERGQIVARSTIELARQLRMKIVAEGVETLEQALFLLGMGCNYAQGYYYSRPLTSREYEDLSFVRRKCFWVDPRLLQKIPRPPKPD